MFLFLANQNSFWSFLFCIFQLISWLFSEMLSVELLQVSTKGLIFEISEHLSLSLSILMQETLLFRSSKYWFSWSSIWSLQFTDPDELLSFEENLSFIFLRSIFKARSLGVFPSLFFILKFAPNKSSTWVTSERLQSYATWRGVSLKILSYVSPTLSNCFGDLHLHDF